MHTLLICYLSYGVCFLVLVCVQTCICVRIDFITLESLEIKNPHFSTTLQQPQLSVKDPKHHKNFLYLLWKPTCATMQIHPDTITDNLFRKFQMK